MWRLYVGLSLFLIGCNAEINTKTITVDCTDHCPTITGIIPKAAKPGERVQLIGTNFQNDMRVMVAGKMVKPDFIDPSHGSFIVPDGKPGELEIKARFQDGDTPASPMYRLASDLPLFTADASVMCQGEKFYDKNGDIKEGTKNCASDLKDLKAESLMQGAKVGGVEGSLANCTADGEENCVVGSGFKAVNTSGLAEKVGAGKSVAGIKGTLVVPLPPPSSCLYI